jgi:hypothetical protein
MNRCLAPRLMTIEEAKRLSYHGQEDDSPQARYRAPSIWSWQTVAGAMAQTVSEDQVEAVLRRRRQD